MPEKEDVDKARKALFDTMKNMGLQDVWKGPKGNQAETTEEQRAHSRRKRRLEFSYKPKEIKHYLDRFVIRQDEAKRVLATAICDHYNHVRSCIDKPHLCQHYVKHNVIMLGPTGVGKTYLVRSLAGLIGVPFVKADATKFSETGYVGADVDELIRELVHKANGDTELAQYGIVYVDEIDKIAKVTQTQMRDVSGSGVQRGLLKIMEDTDVSLRNPQDLQSQLQSMFEYQQKGKVSRPSVNTRHILFIVSGAFGGLDAIIRKRQNSQAIGFEVSQAGEVTNEELVHQVRTEDFVQYGFEPEFIGRLPVRVACDPLSEEDLMQILSASEGSILKQYKEALKAWDIDLHVEADARSEMAKLAHQEGTGARGLATVCERIFRGIKYELPSRSLKTVTLTAEMVRDPDKGLQQLLDNEQKLQDSSLGKALQSYAKRFYEKTGIQIQFSDGAVMALQRGLVQSGRSTDKELDQLFANYSYGLALVQKRKPRPYFLITEAAVHNPNVVLDHWIKESYEAVENKH